MTIWFPRFQLVQKSLKKSVKKAKKRKRKTPGAFLSVTAIVTKCTAHAADEIGAPRYAPNVYTTNGTIEVDIANEFYGDNIDGVPC